MHHGTAALQALGGGRPAPVGVAAALRRLELRVELALRDAPLEAADHAQPRVDGEEGLRWRGSGRRLVRETGAGSWLKREARIGPAAGERGAAPRGLRKAVEAPEEGRGL